MNRFHVCPLSENARCRWLISGQSAQSRRGNRHAFTVVEILVATAVIAILLSLLVPAVQSARETARRTECQNHLRQIMLAFHEHEESYGGFPVPSVDFESWKVRILPFLEQPKPQRSASGQTTGGPKQLPVYACPSDPWSLGSVSQIYGQTYFANNGHGDAMRDGFYLTGGGEPIKARDVTDGLANTAAISERRAIPHTETGAEFDNDAVWRHRLIRKTSAYISDFDLFADECEYRSAPPSVSIYFVDNYNHIQTPNRQSCTNGPRDVPESTAYSAITASSLHGGVVNVANVDGSVKPVSDSIDRGVWRALGTRNGGESTSGVQP